MVIVQIVHFVIFSYIIIRRLKIIGKSIKQYWRKREGRGRGKGGKKEKNIKIFLSVNYYRYDDCNYLSLIVYCNFVFAFFNFFFVSLLFELHL